MTSLCDLCARPGACCKNFALSAGALHDGAISEVGAALAEIVTCSDSNGNGSFIWGQGVAAFAAARADQRVANVRIGLPFTPSFRDVSGRWRYSCPLLGADGRCTDYANRPRACHALQPGAQKPCCHYVPGIGICTERAVTHI
jgi:Fe-S-cluster containining protein